MNRNALELMTGEATKRFSKLSRVANRVNAAHRCAGERLEHSPPAGTHGEPPLAQVRLDRTEDVLGEPLPRALQIQHELRLGGRGREQLVQAELPAP
jgi:hypothetical protein